MINGTLKEYGIDKKIKFLEGGGGGANCGEALFGTWA